MARFYLGIATAVDANQQTGPALQLCLSIYSLTCIFKRDSTGILN